MKTFDTSSSLYTEMHQTDDNNHQYAFGFTTPSPKSPINADSTFSNNDEFKDDVYKLYLTPPTPFEKSTKLTLDDSNPYAQSLWFTFRGNDGFEDIEKYKKVVKDPNGVIARVPEPIKIKRSELLPSMMAKREDVKVEIEQIIEDYDYETELLKPLNNPPPFEFISIQSQLLKKIRCLLEIAIKFRKFNNEHKILLNSKINIYLFSNLETLFIIHNNFFESIINKVEGMDIECLVYDHLQRLYHVYPSYLSTMKLRIHFTKLIINNERFKTFLGADEMKTEFLELIMSPFKDFRKLLVYLDTYRGGSSPRIKVLIEKFLNHFENPNDIMDHMGVDNELLFLEIDSNWKLENAKKWKEIGSLNTQLQVSYYLKYELLKSFEKYIKIINIIKLQIEQISKISILNKYIIKKFIRFQNELPLVDGNHYNYGDYLVNIDDQNKKIYELLAAFTYFISDESFKETQIMVNRACKICKKIFDEEIVGLRGDSGRHNDFDVDEDVDLDVGVGVDIDVDDGYVCDKLFEVYEFKRLFEERLFLIFLKFIKFFQTYIKVVNKEKKGDEITDFKNIIQLFHTQKLVEKDGFEEGKLEMYNQEIGRAFAKGKLIKRFFK